jgi:peptide/nickel transport system permease protein
LIGIVSALICTLLATILALIAGYFGGWSDWGITRTFDLIAALPVILLGIALGAALAISGFHHGPINIESGSLWIPTLIISVILVAYVGRPLRGQILSLREKEFIEASISQGSGPLPRHVRRAAPEHRVDHPRVLHPDHRQQHPGRGRALVPRRRRAAPEPVVGHADLRRAGAHPHRAVADHRPGRRHRDDGRRAQHLR